MAGGGERVLVRVDRWVDVEYDGAGFVRLVVDDLVDSHGADLYREVANRVREQMMIARDSAEGRLRDRRLALLQGALDAVMGAEKEAMG